MSKPYRLTLYDSNGVIERMIPFDAGDEREARSFAERERFGRHASLADSEGVIEWWPDTAFKDVADRLRRGAAQP